MLSVSALIAWASGVYVHPPTVDAPLLFDESALPGRVFVPEETKRGGRFGEDIVAGGDKKKPTEFLCDEACGARAFS